VWREGATQELFGAYLEELHGAMQAVSPAQVQAVVEMLREARARGATIFFCGNGGSASTATHCACDLGKNTIHPQFGRFRTVALNDNVALFSAWANDDGYERAFVEQAQNLMRPGDVLVAISGSGNSPNVLLVAEHARNLGCTVVGLIGFQGGKLRDMCDLALIVPGRTIEQAEDGHLILNHAICTTIRQVDAAAAGADGRVLAGHEARLA
jgi:D-sedoheptulose 7-phosphate isomerase